MVTIIAKLRGLYQKLNCTLKLPNFIVAVHLVLHTDAIMIKLTMIDNAAAGMVVIF